MIKEKLFMDEFLEDRIYDVAQECGFTTFFHEDYVTFEAHSPLGEDISFDVDYDETPFNEDEYISDHDAYFFKVIVRESKAMGRCFDAEERAVSNWKYKTKRGLPTDLQALLDDARCIKIMYQNLALHMRDLHKELEEE